MFTRMLNTNSRKFTPTFRRHRGFTMLEVLLATVLVAISISLAVPTYQSIIEKRELVRSAEQLAAFVSSVQSLSARTNQVVTVSYVRANHDEWCIGASISAYECDCDVIASATYCEIDAKPFVLDETLSGGSELMHSITGGSYSVDPIRGISNAALTMQLHTDSRNYRLNLMVNNADRVILCSRDANHAIPGYDVCPQLVVAEVL